MGGAQPLAATMAGGVVPRRRGRSGAHRASGSRPRYLDERADDLDEALAAARRARGAKRRRARSALVAQRRRRLRRARRGAASRPTSSPTRRPRTIRSSATSRTGCRSTRRAELRAARPGGVRRGARSASMARAGRGDARDAARAARHVFDYGNNLRARRAGGRRARDAFDYPGLRAGVHPAAVLRGQGAVPLGRALGRSRPTSRATDAAVLDALPGRTRRSRRWIDARAASASQFQGLPARICWLGYGERAKRRPRASTSSCARGKVKAPIVIGRDHLDCGSVASPNRETEAMKDGTDAIADWPILNALRQHRGRRDAGCRFHHGGGVGIGYSLHAGHGRRRRRHRTRPRAGSSACSRAIRAWASSATPTPATKRRSRRPRARYQDALTAAPPTSTVPQALPPPEATLAVRNALVATCDRGPRTPG